MIFHELLTKAVNFVNTVMMLFSRHREVCTLVIMGVNLLKISESAISVAEF